MQQIIVSDIFGKTKALEAIAESLHGNIEISDPYEGENLQFKNENQAYKYFMSEVGLEQYAKNLEDFISKFDQQVSLLGFSVGASAIWMISESLLKEQVLEASCFYGSQIRHFKEISPNFPTQIVLPISEEHFSISELKTELSQKNNVSIQQSAYLHGFMNQLSENFDQQGYDQYLQALKKPNHR